MKPCILFNILIISILTLNLSIAQDTIVSKKGNVYYGHIFKVDESYLSFYPDAKNKKSYNQLKSVDIESVKFSFQTLQENNIKSHFKENKLDTSTFKRDIEKENIINVSELDSLKSVFKFDSTTFNANKLANAIQKNDVIENTYLKQKFGSDSSKNSFLSGISDAKRYYDPAYIGHVVFWESLFVPEIAILTNIVASNTSPDEVRCITDDYEKFKNPNYKAGYKNAALKMKRKGIWSNFAGGSIVHVLIIAGLIILL
jgi:hypothetical protein